MDGNEWDDVGMMERECVCVCVCPDGREGGKGINRREGGQREKPRLPV